MRSDRFDCFVCTMCAILPPILLMWIIYIRFSKHLRYCLAISTLFMYCVISKTHERLSFYNAIIFFFVRVPIWVRCQNLLWNEKNNHFFALARQSLSLTMNKQQNVDRKCWLLPLKWKEKQIARIKLLVSTSIQYMYMYATEQTPIKPLTISKSTTHRITSKFCSLFSSTGCMIHNIQVNLFHISPNQQPPIVSILTKCGVILQLVW